ncbi:axoneme-associated protein mst101, putative [Entamoeba dispar SAW760]|uniref:Axoneme-associated protein mst101, putative n=1 Tax=Entamoeba dispar (strain ATCC PRA-260 / SAW760) TaxID=370354 RepID=B0EDX2_ENTDS|nr:axoneme-associated protein mst101, putative [Entamoeba dispar SAW760]EDR27284.1 axoneme-associated protein mst101, putative [Entamoeba dispar SAW760]|eukprot:EDR27284.1 axoneme-associated protein mst101, putative [Entamoeba dispar SAW760]
MLHLFILFIMSVGSFAEEEQGVTGFFVSPIYKIEEKVGILESRLSEIEDLERHVLGKLDQSSLDFKKAIRAADKAKISQIIAVLPAEERLAILRRLKIEYRFNSVKEMIQDATSTSGFTEQQLQEFHKQQIKRAKIDKKTAIARQKLAMAEIEKVEAQKKAKEAEKLAKEKAKQKKAIKSVKAELKKAKKAEKKTNVEINKAVKVTQEKAKAATKKTETLKQQIKQLEKKPLDNKGKAKLAKVTKQLKEAEKTQKKEAKKVERLVKTKYENKVANKKASINKLEKQIKKTTGNTKKQLQQKLINAQSDLKTTQIKMNKKIKAVKEKNNIKA